MHSDGCGWYRGKFYINTNKLGGFDPEEYIALQEDDDVPSLSEEEAEELRAVWEEIDKKEEPWEYYPEVLESQWKEDYGG